MCFQKIPGPPPQRELEILEGSGVQRPLKFLWGEGFEDLNSLPEGTYRIVSCQLSWVVLAGAFVRHAAFFLRMFWLKTTFHFLIKVVSRQTSHNER